MVLLKRLNPFFDSLKTKRATEKVRNGQYSASSGNQNWFDNLDLKAFAKELEAIRKSSERSAGDADINHLKKIESWGRMSGLMGYLSAYLAPNPISAALIALGRTTRWTMVAHHVSHKGYDRLENIPLKYTSSYFAVGWRRFIDWFDWIYPPAWDKEHNILHHYRLGERFDPDLVEDNTTPFRGIRAPKVVKIILFWVLSLVWKWAYYAPSTIKQLYTPSKTEDSSVFFDRLYLNDSTFLPWSKAGKTLWLKSFLPYGIWNFVLLPCSGLLFAPWAMFSMLCNQIMAELFTNLHTFIIIACNHAGDDLYRFPKSIKTRPEFFVRQIVGSANFKTGSDFNDFMHGWLNYQIEHHIWPDMTMLQYKKVQPQVKELCQKWGVPYVQESVWKRVAKLLNIFTGDSSMLVFDNKTNQKMRT